MKQLKYLFFIALATTFSLSTNNANAQQNMMSENHLNKKDRSIITISSYTAQGKLSALKTSLNAGLDAGLTVNEIKEILVHTYAYCGFPRSIRGLQTFMRVVQERKEKGINDTIGKEISPIVSDSTK